MRVAILGNGSAGVMAAAHLSRYFPHFELFHVFDPTRPPIGVGEGTTAGFRAWLEEIAPGSFASFQHQCHATTKCGVQFEGWGASAEPFTHDFVPQDNPGLHVSANDLPSFLATRHRAATLHGRVAGIQREPNHVMLEIDERPGLPVDLVIDARGFPRALGAEHLPLPWIPTNAAVITRGPPLSALVRTRAIARPHGWIFVIPLRTYTSYGYVYADGTGAGEEVEADFTSFLTSQAVDATAPRRTLRFPNFVCRVLFDGRVCKVGNAASFIEPLEATSIALIKSQLTLLTQWLHLADRADGPRMASDLAAKVNASLQQTVIEVSLFIAWHYAAGSAFDTAFWRNARVGFQRGLREGVPASVRTLFEEHVRRASEFSATEVRGARTRTELARVLRGHRDFPRPFGGMTPLGFAQVVEGLDGRATRRASPHQPQ